MYQVKLYNEDNTEVRPEWINWDWDDDSDPNDPSIIIKISVKAP